MFTIKHFLFNLILHLIPKKTLPFIGETGVVTIIGTKHVNVLIYSLHCFFYASKLNLPVTVVDDGTLNISDINKLRSYFKNINIYTNQQCKKRIRKYIYRYYYCKKYREETLTDKFNIKLFDPFLLNSYLNVIYMDYDIIFLKSPREIVEFVKNKNKKRSLYATEYVYEGKLNIEDKQWREFAIRFRKDVCSKFSLNFNSGLLVLKKSSFNLGRINQVLKYIYKHKLESSWLPEQFSLGVIFFEMKAKNLKKDYVHLTRNVLIKNMFNYTCVHFAYQAKSLYYDTALILGLKTLFFRK